MEAFNKNKAMESQKNFCKEKGMPHFAPERTGRCYNCNREIYESFTRKEKTWKGEEIEVTTGITVEVAASQLITGCPHCKRSYCD